MRSGGAVGTFPGCFPPITGREGVSGATAAVLHVGMVGLVIGGSLAIIYVDHQVFNLVHVPGGINLKISSFAYYNIIVTSVLSRSSSKVVGTFCVRVFFGCGEQFKHEWEVHISPQLSARMP